MSNVSTLLMVQAKKLSESGLTNKSIAERLGKTESWVQAAVGLNLEKRIEMPVVAFVSSPEFVLMKKAKELTNCGMTKANVGKTIGKKESWVLGTLAIMTKLPQCIHDAIEKDKISRTTALQLLFAPPERMEKICAGVIKLCETEKL